MSPVAFATVIVLLLPARQGWPQSDFAKLTAAAKGREIYQRYCWSCHGRDGDGNGPTARFLRTRPRDFTTGQYKWRTTPTGSPPTDDDIVRTIKRGAPGTPMPGWEGRLSEEEVRAVVAFIRGFAQEDADEDREPPIYLPEPPEMTPESVRRGQSVYVLMQCWSCHGLTGTGDGPSASTLRDDDGEPIDAYDFTGGDFHSGGTALDIYRTFSTGVNGTPMPSFSEVLFIGRDMFDQPSPVIAEVTPTVREDLERFIASLPPNDVLDEMSEEQQAVYTTRLRWNLVHYVQSLSRNTSTIWRWLWRDPYLTE